MASLLPRHRAALRAHAADVLAKAGNDAERRAGVAMNSLANGADLGSWFDWFERKRRAKLKQPQPMARWIDELDEGKPINFDKIDAYHEADEKLKIFRDEAGQPVVTDSIDEVASFVYWAATREPVTPWEATSATEKKKRLGKVAGLAIELAKELERTNGPGWPPAIDLFEVANVPRSLRLRLGGHQRPDALQPLRDQSLGQVLRRLAERAEREGRKAVRDKRPLTNDPDARVLAREASHWFEHRYGSVPNEIVADIVNVLLSRPRDSLFSGETVREWRGMK